MWTLELGVKANSCTIKLLLLFCHSIKTFWFIIILNVQNDLFLRE